jgi:hypothetical protein
VDWTLDWTLRDPRHRLGGLKEPALKLVSMEISGLRPRGFLTIRKRNPTDKGYPKTDLFTAGSDEIWLAKYYWKQLYKAT